MKVFQMSEIITTVEYAGKQFPLYEEEIREFKHYLEHVQNFGPSSIDTHISMMYGGNQYAIFEFVQWRDWNKLNKTEHEEITS